MVKIMEEMVGKELVIKAYDEDDEVPVGTFQAARGLAAGYDLAGVGWGRRHTQQVHFSDGRSATLRMEIPAKHWSNSHTGRAAHKLALAGVPRAEIDRVLVAREQANDGTVSDRRVYVLREGRIVYVEPIGNKSGWPDNETVMRLMVAL